LCSRSRRHTRSIRDWSSDVCSSDLVCAAIAAARQGARVALVQNRPVLGGNSSSEVRVWVCGATAHGVQHYARETGIMGELFLEKIGRASCREVVWSSAATGVDDGHA